MIKTQVDIKKSIALPLDNEEQTYINYILFMACSPCEDPKIREFIEDYKNSPFEKLRNRAVLRSIFQKIKYDEEHLYQ